MDLTIISSALVKLMGRCHCIPSTRPVTVSMNNRNSGRNLTTLHSYEFTILLNHQEKDLPIAVSSMQSSLSHIYQVKDLNSRPITYLNAEQLTTHWKF